jgi:outer membrane protein OmpA-like peptidoglycan-associated protein
MDSQSTDTQSTQSQSQSQKDDRYEPKTAGETHGKVIYPQTPATSVQNVNLFFKTASAQLSESANADLQALADWARCDKNNAIILEGFADPRGSVEYNQKLGARRAAAVREKLIGLGVPSQRIVVSVFGENGPKKPSMAQERRVTARASESPVMPRDMAG